MISFIVRANVIKCITILASLLFCNPALSEETENQSGTYKAWGSLGYGLFLAQEGERIGQGYLVGLTVQKNSHVFILRGNVFEDNNFIQDIVDGFNCVASNIIISQECVDEERTFTNIGLLYGRRSKNRILAIGLERVQAEAKSRLRDVNTLQTVDVKRELFSEVGLVLEAQYLVSLKDNYGVTVNFMGNINKESPYVGITLNMNLGKLK